MSPLVIKVGGAFIDAPEGQRAFFENIKKIQAQRPVIIVHGGGAGVQKILEALGFTSTKKAGLRVTPAEHMPYVAATLAGEYATKMLSFALAQNLPAVSLTVADGGMTVCQQHPADVGCVGIPAPKSPALLKHLLAQNFVPIINSIGIDHNAQLMNVNADQAATIIATLVSGELLLLSDVPGVLDGDKQKLPTLSHADYQRLVDEQVITDGMLVKVAAAIESAQTLRRPVIIGDWSKTHLLHAASLTDFGTHILPE